VVSYWEAGANLTADTGACGLDEIMDHSQRIETLKASLFEPIAPVWEEPFHEAWLAAEGEEELIPGHGPGR